MGMTRVLVVEDDAAVQRLLRLTLTQGGFDVDLASDGLDAFHHLDQESPDAIVLDLQMPHMDGEEFLRRLRARGDRTPVLVVSAYADRPRRSLGADAFIAKPFSPDAVVEAVEHLIAKHQDR
jgi:DNA-binding response OmpR family regulator